MIFGSPHPDVEIPDQAFTPYVLARAAELGDTPALIDGPTGRALSYADLVAGVARVAASLAERGIGKGDVVALDAPNMPEYALAFHGVASAGGVVTTINPVNTVEEVARQLTDSGARMLITIAPLLEKASEAARQAGGIEEIFVIGGAVGAEGAEGTEGTEDGAAGADGAAIVTPFSALLEEDAPAPDVDIDPAEDLLVLPYSSGTTGLPKGVMLTHRNLVANVEQTLAVEQVEPGEMVVGILPFFHIYGMTVVMSMALRAGATVVTLPRFDLAGFLDTLQRYSITRTHLVPPIIIALAKHPLVDDYDLSALRWITSGAAPLGAETVRACADRLGCVVRQGYGLTETSPVTHFVPTDRAGENPGSVGPALPNTEVRIVDLATGDDLGVGEEGEVWIRGPQVMKGYLHAPEATARTLTSDGWLRTGDIGVVGEDGALTIVDRAKELIKYKGFQVPPAELEAVLLSHPDIADAAVIGKPDAEAGEVPKAFVVRRGSLSADDVMGFVAQHVAPYKKVREVEFREAIPKSASGKILRRVLVQEERARRAGTG